MERPEVRLDLRAILYLSWRYVRYHRLKSAVLLAGMSLTLLLPVSMTVLVDRYDRWLKSRADATPMVIGMPGNRFDLVLRALYFRPGKIGSVPYGIVEEIHESGLAQAVPIHVRHTAGGFPVVGTSLDYFDFRSLTFGEGHAFTLLGEAVLGHEVAQHLGLGADSVIRTDQDNVYDLTKSFPLQLAITGVLEETGTADDSAIFVDIRTAWIVEGLGHGHQDLTSEGTTDEFVLRREDDRVIANAALPTYVEITPENIDSFHFHGDLDDLPVSAVIAIPGDARAATLLKARINGAGEHQALVPSNVTTEMMGLVFRIKRFFDANLLLVSTAVLMLLVLVLLLSHRLRRNEFTTLHRLGGSRHVVAVLQIAELGIILTGALVLAGVGVVILLQFAPDMLAWFG